MTIRNWISLSTFILVCELAGVIGSVFTVPAIPGWYAGLIKPELNPPAWIFAPVWTILYALMGIAAFMIWNLGMKRKQVKTAMKIFGLQLGLNLLWSIIFFGFHNPGLAFGGIVLLWLAIAWCIKKFLPLSRPAAWLLVPYLVWVSFAAYLNLAIWELN